VDSADPVKNWEEEDPDEVYEVPIQPHIFYGGEIGGIEVATRGSAKNPREESDSDDDV